jgi:hypothetical protein
VTYCLSEAIALYGMVLHFLGFGLSQIVPFFIAGLGLIIFYWPRTTGNREFPPADGR